MDESLSLEERILIQLRRNRKKGVKPQSNRDLAAYIGKSPVYVGEIIEGYKLGTKGRYYLNEIRKYVGV